MGDLREELHHTVGKLEVSLSLPLVFVEFGSHLLLVFLVQLRPIRGASQLLVVSDLLNL
jgi:hypothetical protein